MMRIKPPTPPEVTAALKAGHKVIISQPRRDQIAAAVITGYLASFANPSVKLAETGLPSPDRMATVVAAYTDAILKELDA